MRRVNNEARDISLVEARIRISYWRRKEYNQEGKMRHVTTESHWFHVEHEQGFLIWLESLDRGRIFEVPSLPFLKTG
jgi:hypothetical protein